MTAQRNPIAEVWWTWSVSMLILIRIVIMGVCVLPMVQARPARIENPKEVKHKDPGQKLETLLSDLNHQKATLKTELARLHQRYGPPPTPQQTVYVVQAGDTLAAIARTFYGRDIKLREAVAAIRQANPGLTDSGLRPGQTLQVPAPPGRKQRPSTLDPAQPDRGWEEELDHWLVQMQVWTDELNRTAQELNVENHLQKAHTWKQGLLNHETINQWQQDLNAWQESEDFRTWQNDIQSWGQTIEGFVRGKTADPNDSNAAPLPVMPTMPRLPALPAPVPQPDIPVGSPAPPGALTSTPKPKERHRIEARIWEETPEDASSTLRVNNPHGNITLQGQESHRHTSVFFIIQGCDRERAEELVHPIAKAIPQGETKELFVDIKLPKHEDREHIRIDVEIVIPGDTPVEARTNMGTIRLENLNAEVKALTNMGTITAQHLTGATACRSNMGAIRFITPKDPSLQITASTNLGSLHTDLDLGKTSDSSNTLKGKLGSGSQRVNLGTNMGSIHIGTESFIEKQTAKDKTRPQSKRGDG